MNGSWETGLCRWLLVVRFFFARPLGNRMNVLEGWMQALGFAAKRYQGCPFLVEYAPQPQKRPKLSEKRVDFESPSARYLVFLIPLSLAISLELIDGCRIISYLPS